MLAFFSVDDSEKRAASVDQLKNADSSILLKKNSLTKSLTDTEKYILLNHHLTLGTDTFAQKKIHNKMIHFKHLGREHSYGLVTANQKMGVSANTVCYLQHTPPPVCWLTQQ